ncbi:MAG: ATP-binding protein [Tissierellia bacterium]|nr:ATP-binding protein [Tissierellia bacterium]
MKVVGITSQQEFFIGSNTKNFRINEYLIVEDKLQGDLVGEVVEANTYNRYIPLNINGDFVDSDVLQSLRAIGYNIDEETIYIAKIRLLSEALYPIETGSDIRVPKFDEVKKLLMRSNLKDGLVIGSIRNTEELTADMDGQYKDLFNIFSDDGYTEQSEVPFIYDIRDMHQYPHIGIFGGSGSGKSYGLRVLLEELMKKNIPTIVLDPHYEMTFEQNTENSKSKIDYSNRYTTLHLGTDIGVKFEDINVSDLKNLLNAASSLTDSMNNAVDVLFRGKSSLYSFFDKLNMLTEAQEIGSVDKLRERVDYESNPEHKKAWEKRLKLYETYDKLCPYSSVKGILWRLKRLDNEGIFQNDVKPVIDGLQSGKLVVIQGNTRILQVFSTYILNNLYQKRRAYKDAAFKKMPADYFPPFIIITDEAHNFAPKGYDSPSKSVLKEISQEGRKYGVFLVLATQRPTLLDETITAQLNSKFIFRTVRASDIQTIREETDLTAEESKRLPYLQTGDVFVSQSSLGRTISVRVRASETLSPHTENPFDELNSRTKQDIEDFLGKIEKYLPIHENDILQMQQDFSSLGINIDRSVIENKLEELVKNNILEKESTFLGNRYILK